MRLHLVSLPHAHVSRDVTVCAFTTKTAKFLTMMSTRGWEIVLYGGAESVVDKGVELVPLYTTEEQVEWFGDFDANTLPIVAGSWDMNTPQYMTTNTRAVAEISKRYETGDLILLTGGYAQLPIYTAFKNIAVVAEWAAGYSGVIFSDRSLEKSPWVCFESQSWRHFMYGKWGVDDGRFFDTVIPNFFAPEEWELAKRKEDYLVFVGRMIARKGPQIAAEIARELQMPIYFAGSGVGDAVEGRIACMDGTILEGDVHYVGTVGVKERNELVSKAKALIAPTRYIEPFGAVAVEGPLCGTPAVTTDFGAFVDTVPRSLRFNTLQEGVQATGKAMSLYPERVREEALARFSLEAVAPLYEEWFHRLGLLWGDGWYERS